MFRGLQKEEIVLLTHGDSVDKVADGFKVVARSGNIVAGENYKTFADFISSVLIYAFSYKFSSKKHCFCCLSVFSDQFPMCVGVG